VENITIENMFSIGRLGASPQVIEIVISILWGAWGGGD
jgi:hypothetical protein